MICEIQYGGKITDNLDRELFAAYGEIYFRETLFQPESILTKAGDFKYVVPNGIEHKQYLDYIDLLPGVDNPELFGLNANSDIAFRTKETKEMINTIMTTRPKESSGGTGLTREELISQKAASLLKQITYTYEISQVKKLISKLPGPKNYPEKGLHVPLNIFLL